MKVEPIPWEPLRFRVQSERKNRKWYLVELEAQKLNGQCNCEDFQMRHGPMLKVDYMRRHHRCKHIRAALEFFADQMLKAIANEIKKKRQTR